MTTLKYLNFVSKVICLILFFNACTQSDYTKLVKGELSKGIRMDSIIFGINLGDTRDEFYGKCFDLNKKQLVTQGPRGATVQYLFTDSIVHQEPTDLRLLFIPAFDEKEIIKEFNLEFSYTAWSPWNADLQSDKLIEKVKDIIMMWYKGNPFVTVKLNDQDLPVKVDGNRRLILYIKDEQNVVVKVHDILHPAYKHSITK